MKKVMAPFYCVVHSAPHTLSTSVDPHTSRTLHLTPFSSPASPFKNPSTRPPLAPRPNATSKVVEQHRHRRQHNPNNAYVVVPHGTPKYAYIDSANTGKAEAKRERMHVIPATAELALMP